MTRPVTLIAGASGGLGSACAEVLAARGHNLRLAYHHGREAAEAVADRCRALGADAAIQALDLPDGDLGALDDVACLVWAVGPEIAQPRVGQLDAEALARVLSIEAVGFCRLLTAVLPSLRAHRGNVVALTSAGNRRHPPGDVLSTAPKAAVEALIRATAREEGRYGVRANAVAVGVVDAGMFQRIAFEPGWREAAIRAIPMRRLGEAREVGEVVAFLASEAASYVTGEVLHVDGGYRV